MGNERSKRCIMPDEYPGSTFDRKFMQNYDKMTERTAGKICVVLVVDDLGYGGTERQVIELANYVDRDRFDTHVCALSDHLPLKDTLKDQEHRLHIIKSRTRLDFTIVPRLAFLLRALKADIVHGYLFRAEIVSRIAGRMAGTDLVLGSERNANRVILSRRNVWAFKLTFHCVDAIIANSNAGAKDNGRVYKRPLTDYRVVHNGVNTERFQPRDGTMIRRKLGIPLQCPVIGMFANFKIQKNHPMLFRAFKLVLDSFPEAQLLLVGGVPTNTSSKLDRDMVRLVDDLKIRHRCMFLGVQTDVEQLYPACDITVLPSFHEGTPNVLLESMACGVPVVATNVCDNEYIVRDCEMGHLVAVGDVVGLAHRMKLLLGNSSLRQEMGRRARNWVIEEFSCKRMAKKMEAVYMELLSKKT